MNPTDVDRVVESVLASLGGRATASDVETAASQVLEAMVSPATGTPLIWIRISVSVADCSSRRSPTQRARVYDRIRLAASSLKLLVQDVAKELAVSMPHMELNVRDSSSLLYGHDSGELLSVAEAMSQAAIDTGVSIIRGPFLDLALEQNSKYMSVLPELLAISPALRPMVQIGTKENGFDPDIVHGLALAACIHNKSQHLRGHGSPQCTVFVNGCDRRAFDLRVHPDQDFVCALAEESSDLNFAASFSDALQQTALVRGHDISMAAHEFTTTSTEQASLRDINSSGAASHRLSIDGLPPVGPFRNKVSVPSGYDPSDLAAFLSERLSAFSQTGIQAGIHIDFPRS